MESKLLFEPHVAEDLADALRHYDSIAIQLGNRFRQRVNERLDDIAARAESFPTDIAPVRFAKIEQFPYLIFFVVRPDFVTILAIVHGASDPRRWKHRN